MFNRLKAPSDWPTLAEYCIVQHRPAVELGPPQASKAKLSSSGPLVATAELQLSYSLFYYIYLKIHFIFPYLWPTC